MASAAQFRVEHVAQAPRGWRVRTKMAGTHRARIAFPPGPRRKGAGKLLEILHPKGERNPECKVNPAELVIFGNPKRRSKNILHDATNLGAVVREAKRLSARDRVAVFIEKEDGSSTYTIVYYKPSSKPGTHVVRSFGLQYPNPKRRRNQSSGMEQAVQLFQTFHGKDPKGVIEKHISAEVRKDYATLGGLDYLIVRNTDGKDVKLNFDSDGVTLASSPDGHQLYFIGGNQNLASCLDKFTDDAKKDFIDLGDAVELQYLARKAQGGFQPVNYFHKFGEQKKGSDLPRAFYDKLRRQMFLSGGDYTVKEEGIVN